MTSMSSVLPDLNLLVAFEALYAERSVTAAARRQGIGQPAMSAALARLRRLFDDDLFVRVGTGMQPTPRAEALGPPIAQALHALRASVLSEATFDPATSTRRFTIAASDGISMVVMPRAITLLRREAPGVDLRIIALDKQDAPALLETAQADLVLGTIRRPAQRLVTTTLYRERFIGIARIGHPLLAADAIGLDAWLSWPHALFTLQRDQRGEIDDVLARRGRERRVALSVAHLLTLPALLAATDLLAAVPSRLAPMLCGSAITTFPLPLPTDEWRVMTLSAPSMRRDRGRLWLRDLVRRAASGL